MQEIFISTVSKSYKLDCNYRNLISFLNLTPMAYQDFTLKANGY